MAVPYNPEMHGDINAVATKPPEPVQPNVVEQTEASLYDDIKPLMGVIGNKESTNNYNAYFGKADNNEVDFTNMAIDDVLDWQDQFVAGGSKSSAVGKYQIIRKTMKDLKRTMGLTGKETFSQELQDKMFVELAKRRGYEKWANGDITSEEFADNLAKEWASLPVVTGEKRGRSYYANDGLNKALITPEEVLRALGEERLPADLVAQTEEVAPEEQGIRFERDADGRMLRIEGGRTYDARTGEVLGEQAGPDTGPDVGTITESFAENLSNEVDNIRQVADSAPTVMGELDKLGQGAPEGIAGGITGDASLEGATKFTKDVVGADMFLNTKKSLDEGNAAGALAEVALEVLPPGIEEFARSMFIGPKSAKTGAEFLDRSSGESIYERFIKAEESGADMEEVRKNLGWFRDTDGTLQFEIDDSMAKYVGDKIQNIKPITAAELKTRGVNGLYENAKYRLPDVLDHPTLYDEYPELLNLRVGFFKNIGEHANVGGFAMSDGKLLAISEGELKEPEKLRKVILHEVGHIIQAKEGFTGGNSINDIKMKILSEVDPKLELDMTDAIEKAWAKVPSGTWASKLTDGTHLALQHASLLGKEKGSKYIKKAMIDKGIPIPAEVKLDDLWNGVVSDTYSGRIVRNATMLRNSFPSEEAFDEWMKLQTKALKKVEAFDLEAKARYYSTLGEANSRNIEARADFSPETRREVNPKTTRDIPEKMLLDRDGNRIWKAK